MNPLGGLRIVVTRPLAQAASLADLIRAAGGEPVLFPTIDIVALPDYAELDAVLDRLAQFDLAIFVSANAVQHAFARLVGRAAAGKQGNQGTGGTGATGATSFTSGAGATWPPQTRVAATGPATAAQLVVHLRAAGAAPGIDHVIYPAARFDSEGLIAELDRLAMAPQQVLIVRGTGGRDWLFDQLTARGARVEVVPSYARVRGRARIAPLLDLAATRRIAAVTVTSSEGGENLIAMLGQDAPALCGLPLFVPHPRIAARMRALGCTQLFETPGGDAGLMSGLTAHFAKAA